MSRPLTALAAAGATSAALVAAEALTYAAKRREIAGLRARCAAAGAIAITFDDGPGPVLTPRLLELLERHGAPATFFALGRRAVRAPSTLDAVRDAGHEIGCHTFDHHNAWRTPPSTALADIAAGYDALAPWVAPDGRFRPPNGKQTLLTRRAIARRGAAVAWWTVDSGDTHPSLPDPGHAAQALCADGGGVVLLHDHDDRPDGRDAFVLDATERILVAARDAGLRVVALRDL